MRATCASRGVLLLAILLAVVLLLVSTGGAAAVGRRRGVLQAGEGPSHVHHADSETRSLLSAHSEASSHTALAHYTTDNLWTAYDNIGNNAHRQLDQLRQASADYWRDRVACDAAPASLQACVVALSKKWDGAYHLARLVAVTPVKGRSVAHATRPHQAFYYHLDARGRVTVAQGFVGGANNPESDPMGAASDFCMILKQHFGANYLLYPGGPTPGTVPNALRDTAGAWSRGHIIGASLGGSNSDPLNFFPQRQFDNSGGRWKSGEDVATMFLSDLQSLRDLRKKAKMTDMQIEQCVHVQMELHYPHLEDVVPSGGVYQVTVNRHCLTKYTWTSWGNTNHVDNDMVQWNTPWSQDETQNSVMPGQRHAIKDKPVRGA